MVMWMVHYVKNVTDMNRNSITIVTADMAMFKIIGLSLINITFWMLKSNNCLYILHIDGDIFPDFLEGIWHADSFVWHK